jgi:hypothetical protein
MKSRIGVVAILAGAACVLAAPRPALAGSGEDLVPMRVTVHVTQPRTITAGGLTWSMYSSIHGGGFAQYVHYVKLLRAMQARPAIRFGQAPAQASASAGETGAVALSIVGEAAYGFGDGGRFTGLAGPRIAQATSSRVALFGQVLGGLVHNEIGNSFTLQPGGGVWLAFEGQPFVLALNLDVPIDFYDFGSRTGLRFGGGIVFVWN